MRRLTGPDPPLGLRLGADLGTVVGLDAAHADAHHPGLPPSGSRPTLPATERPPMTLHAAREHPSTIRSPPGPSSTSDDITAPVSRLARVARRRIVAVIDPVWARGRPRTTPAPRGPSSSGPPSCLTARLQPGELVLGHPARDGSCSSSGARTAPRGPYGCRRWPTSPSRSSTACTAPAASSTSASAGPRSPASRTRPPRRTPRPRRPRESLRQRDLQPRQDGVHVASRNPRISWLERRPAGRAGRRRQRARARSC